MAVWILPSVLKPPLATVMFPSPLSPSPFSFLSLYSTAALIIPHHTCTGRFTFVALQPFFSIFKLFQDVHQISKFRLVYFFGGETLKTRFQLILGEGYSIIKRSLLVSLKTCQI
jgi:hypothetical protein